MKKLRTVVSGLGRIGWQFHIPSINSNAGFELVGVSDPIEERLQEAKEAFGVNCYADYFEMVDAEKPDLVVICSPTHVHAAQAIYAMENGFDVFLDKPMARDLDEAKRIADVCERTGKKLMVYQPSRATAVAQSLKTLMDSGIIGDIFLIKVASISYVFRNDWQAFKKYGGGMLSNYGAHEIDRILYLAGAGAKKVSAAMARIASLGDADDFVKILMEMENGINVDIEVNMAASIDFPQLLVYGTNGAVSFHWGDEGPYFNVRHFDPKDRETIPLNDSLAAPGRKYMGEGMSPKSWKEDMQHISDDKAVNFYDKCYDFYVLGKEAFVPLSDTLEVMRIMNECRKYSGWSQE